MAGIRTEVYFKIVHRPYSRQIRSLVTKKNRKIRIRPMLAYTQLAQHVTFSNNNYFQLTPFNIHLGKLIFCIICVHDALMNAFMNECIHRVGTRCLISEVAL